MRVAGDMRVRILRQRLRLSGLSAHLLNNLRKNVPSYTHRRRVAGAYGPASSTCRLPSAPSSTTARPYPGFLTFAPSARHHRRAFGQCRTPTANGSAVSDHSGSARLARGPLAIKGQMPATTY
jgi:hypothetical protein